MSTVEQSIISITRTVYGLALQAAKVEGIPFELTPFTTLNEKLGIQSGVAPQTGQYPNLRYLAIGNLGHSAVTAEDGSIETVPLDHEATDAGLWGMIPFALKEIGSDFNAEQRARYALRRQETHNNVDYFAYYLRRLDMTNSDVTMNTIEVVNGQVNVTPFVPNSDNLNPTRPTVSNQGTVQGSNTSVAVSSIVTLSFDETDVEEIMNAHRIRTNSTRSPVISELALVSGVDREVTGSSGGAGSFNYTETIAAQINAFISTNIPIGYNSAGAQLILDVGGMEVMPVDS